MDGYRGLWVLLLIPKIAAYIATKPNFVFVETDPATLVASFATERGDKWTIECPISFMPASAAEYTTNISYFIKLYM
jgi:hypothetical protein